MESTSPGKWVNYQVTPPHTSHCGWDTLEWPGRCVVVAFQDEFVAQSQTERVALGAQISEFLDQADERLKKALVEVLESTARLGGRFRLVHLLDALLAEPTAAERLSAEQRTVARAKFAELIRAEPAGDGRAVSAHVQDLLKLSLAAAQDHGASCITPLTLLEVCMSATTFTDPDWVRAQELLRVAGFAPFQVATAVVGAARADFTFASLGFGTDLTAMARGGVWATCPLIGCERELKRLAQLISSGSDSACVVGEPGVGKSVLVYGLAYHIAHGTRPLIPPALDSTAIVMITATNLLAGTGERGGLEQKIEQMLAFFRKNPLVIPFFDEVHTLLNTEDEASRVIATALKPPMARGQFRCIGATTDREFARFIAADEAMNSRFSRILVPEPGHEDAAKMISGTLSNLFDAGTPAAKVRILPEAIQAAVKLSARYLRSDRLPRKGVRLLRMAVAEKAYAVATGAASEGPTTEQDVAATLSDLSGIPIDSLVDDESAAGRLREDLRRIRGQASAVNAVVSWLRMQSCGWLDPRRPRGRFLFLGPPGVGKTELAMQLAESVMRDRGSLVVKNMAEYKGEGSRSKFMGADPGYVGFGQTPTIYSKIMMRPFSVVVLDELEKAHPELTDPLLSVLDGYAEDSQGRWVDFSQCIFVMTSNAIQIPAPSRLNEDLIRRALVAQGGMWQPALVDRIDRVVLFNALDEAALLEILGDMVERRKRSAAKPLPERINSPEAREEILREATREGPSSARGMERSLTRWLILEGRRAESTST